MGLLASIDIAASALEAERLRMVLLANNLANAESTRDAAGVLRPYRRRIPVFQQGSLRLTGDARFGVTLAEVLESAAPPRRVWDPEHPDAVRPQDVAANRELTAEDLGFVLYPNVNVATEMVDMVEASRAYQANVQAVALARAMIRSALELLG